MYSVFIFHFISWFFARKHYRGNDTFTLLEKIGTNSASEKEWKTNEVSDKNTSSNLTTLLTLNNNNNNNNNNNTMIPNGMYNNGMDNRYDSISEKDTILLQKIYRFFEKKNLLAFLENPNYSLITKVELLETISKSDTILYDDYYKNYGFHLLNGGFWNDWE